MTPPAPACPQGRFWGHWTSWDRPRAGKDETPNQLDTQSRSRKAFTRPYMAIEPSRKSVLPMRMLTTTG